jgi:hypothetical protein
VSLVKMKPETIARRAAERVAKRAAARTERIRRLREIIEQRRDPSGVYAELLAEAEAECE